ncbi:Membrane-associated guanylate kinase, WW and PDZ domain-containing protein 3 [Aix galericulata]|nr:Membrane-associated guanylate kinase, WW and PDZ domain-containing protein 3 [Aix galericulata]
MYQTEGQSGLVSLRRCLVLICSLLGLIHFQFSGPAPRAAGRGFAKGAWFNEWAWPLRGGAGAGRGRAAVGRQPRPERAAAARRRRPGCGMSKTLRKKRHWLSKVQECVVSWGGAAGPDPELLRGGAERGEFPYLAGRLPPGSEGGPGPALLSGKAPAPGDVLLEVNGTPVSGLTHRDALAVIRHFREPVRLKTVRPGEPGRGQARGARSGLGLGPRPRGPAPVAGGGSLRRRCPELGLGPGRAGGAQGPPELPAGRGRGRGRGGGASRSAAGPGSGPGRGPRAPWAPAGSGGPKRSPWTVPPPRSGLRLRVTKASRCRASGWCPALPGARDHTR